MNTGGSSTGGTSGSSTGGTSGSGNTGGNLGDCDGAAEMQPCTLEGQSCGSCTNVCNFCNLLRCVSGSWQRFEAPPAPCFDCGDDVRCQISEAYCRIDNGAVRVAQCVSLPAACETNVTCTCLGPENPGYACSGDPGSVTLERSGG